MHRDIQVQRSPDIVYHLYALQPVGILAVGVRAGRLLHLPDVLLEDILRRHRYDSWIRADGQRLVRGPLRVCDFGALVVGWSNAVPSHG